MILPMPKYRVGLIGCGNIGTAFAELLTERRQAISAMTGIDLELARIAVKDPAKKRADFLPLSLFVEDPIEVASAPDIDIIVELVGGVDPAREVLLTAIGSGKPVVTANKELIARHGPELFEAAQSNQVDVFFEAAAVAAVPILRPLRESFAGEDVVRIMGIINGTTNYMLTRMSDEGISYDEALSLAQQYGYAEPDPSADVEGTDAASKLAILASLAFKRAVPAEAVQRDGIEGLDQEDFQLAARFGYEIKLLAVAKAIRNPATGEPEIGAQVFPALVEKTHPLASVRDTYNAVAVSGAAAGELMFIGHGAGRAPTASAILGDVIATADHLQRDSYRSVPVGPRATPYPIDDLTHAFYVRMHVADEPGVLSDVSGVLARHGVSIRLVNQEGLRDTQKSATVVFITYQAAERAMREAMEELRSHNSVVEVGRVLRILET
jgi:homoserine dehydrogenase